MRPELRSGNVADVPALQAVEARAGAMLQGHAASAVFAAHPTPRAAFERACRAGDLIVAVLDGTVVGYAMHGLLGHSRHLQQMDVDPAYGRRGIGRQLLESVCDVAAARGESEVVLTTLCDVPWNAPFYASAGFVVFSDAEMPARVRAILDLESRLGFPMSLRVAMRRFVDAQAVSREASTTRKARRPLD